MGKLSKKLVVYLDQNFISEMAKASTNDRVNAQFSVVYELLHQGFKDEKLVVPMSFFHDIETSFAPELRDRFRAYQGHLGQIRLRLREQIEADELNRAIQRFQGEEPLPIGYDIAFNDDPDQRLERFAIRGNIDYGTLGILGERQRTTTGLEETRRAVQNSGRSYKEQVELEIEDHARNLFPDHYWMLRRFSTPEQLQAFVRSEHFRAVPSIDMFARMWSKLLVDYRDRPIRSGDDTDIKLISAYLPYVDVLATDTFMTTLIRNLKLDTEHSTEVFGANKHGLADFEAFLTVFLAQAPPVNWPTLSIFILSDNHIKQNSGEFFRKLGNHVRSCERRNGGWIEVFAFDDGNMPQYGHAPSGTVWPFYGLQDVTQIPLPPGSTRDSILRICRERSRARKLVLIDTYTDLPPGFVRQLLDAATSGQAEVLGYIIRDP